MRSNHDLRTSCAEESLDYGWHPHEKVAFALLLLAELGLYFAQSQRARAPSASAAAAR